MSTEMRPKLRLVNAPQPMWRGTVHDLQEIWRRRELLRALAGRELRSRYKGTALGWLWALIRPLVMLLVYGLAVGVFLGADRSTPEFMVFVYSGLLAWTLFSTLVLGSINVIVANGPVITRSSFPRLLLPLSVVLSAGVDFMLQASVLLVGYGIYDDWPTAGHLLWLLPAVLVLVLSGLTAGLILGAVNVYVRDIAFLTDVALQVGFWLTPIIYSYGQVYRGAQHLGSISPALVTRLYMTNPMANVIIGFQRALWPPVLSASARNLAFTGRLAMRFAVLSAVMMALCWVAMRIFSRLSANFGQEL